MPRAGFYNENEYRDYPFLTRVGAGSVPWLPHATIVDFGAIMGIDAEYMEEDSHVYLYRIRREGTTFYFDFAVHNGEVTDYLIFEREIDAEEFTIEHAASDRDPAACALQPVWEGYLVTGTLDELIAQMPGDGEHTFSSSEWIVEPGRIQSLRKALLRSISLANFPRTLSTLPERCESESPDYSQAIPNATCLTGDLYFKEGFNCAIRQEDATNTIIIGAAVGGGAGEQCEEFPWYDNEPLPDPESPYYSGGPTCSDVIKTINGVGGRHIQLIAGPGFRVASDPEESGTLHVFMDLDDFALCLLEEEEVVVEESSEQLGSE